MSVCWSVYPQITPNAWRLHSGPAAELIAFNSSQCVCLQWMRVRHITGLPRLRRAGENTQNFYFCRMPEHNASIRHRAGRVRQEAGCRNKKRNGLFIELTKKRFIILHRQQRRHTPLSKVSTSYKKHIKLF